MSSSVRRRSHRLTLVAVPVLATVVAALAPAPSIASGATSAPPAPATAATTADPLLPDLRPVQASDLMLQQTQSGDRKLRFSSRLANIGRGPLEVRPNSAQQCPTGQRHASQIIYRDVDDNSWFNRSVDTRTTRRSAGCMLFHAAHNHWHFEATARYSIFRPDGESNIIARQRKMSFCLRDSEPVPASFGTFNQPQYYGDCARDTPQGISRGWVDLYSYYLVGQALTLPPSMGDGVYCLRIRVDPKDEVRESDELNQISTKAFELREDEILPVDTRPCA